MSLLGFDAIGREALGQITTSAPATLVFAAMSSAGAALMDASGSSIAAAAIGSAGIATLAALTSSVVSSSMVGAGHAVLSPILTAKVTAVVTAQGNSSMSGSNNPAATVQFAGHSQFSPVIYASYLDAEKAGPKFESRVAYAHPEARSAVAPFEDRVYYTNSKPATKGPPNRRRTL